MQLTILSLPAATRFVLHIDENATLETLKAAIFQQVAIPEGFQILSFAGENLTPGPLADQEVGDHSLIVLTTIRGPPFVHEVTFLGDLYSVQINRTDSVRTLKHKLFELTGTTPGYILLEETGKKLEDTSTFSDYDVLSGTRLYASLDAILDVSYDDIWLYIKPPTGDDIPLIMPDEDTIMSIRELVQWEGVPIFGPKFDLLFAGQSLENHRTLSSYSIQSGSAINIVLRSEPSSASRIQIAVKNIQGTTLILHPEAHRTLSWVSRMVQTKLGHPMDKQQFVHRGRPLTDSDMMTSLPNLGVCNEDILYCTQAVEADDDLSSWTLGSPKSQGSTPDWVILSGTSQREQDDDIEMTGFTDDMNTDIPTFTGDPSQSSTLGHPCPRVRTENQHGQDALSPTDVHRDCAAEINDLRARIIEKAEANLKLEKEIKQKTDESTAMAEQIDILTSELKSRENVFKDDALLFEKSPLHKRLNFQLLIHTKYDQISEMGLGDIDAFNNDLERYVDMTEIRYCHDEEFYVSKLRQLRSRISSWAGKITFDQPELQSPIENVLSVLKKISRVGERTEQFIQDHNFVGNFDSRRRRKILYAHLMTLAIYEHVLSSFAFGMERSLSKKFYALENSILTQETDFGKILRVRQTLGVAAVQYVEALKLLEQKNDLTSMLKELFSEFLPQNTFSSEFIFDIITEAVDLRNDMTRERATFSFFWFPTDSKIDLDSSFYEFEGWSDDPLHLCVCPGICESFKWDDGSIRELCISPAKVELE